MRKEIACVILILLAACVNKPGYSLIRWSLEPPQRFYWRPCLFKTLIMRLEIIIHFSWTASFFCTSFHEKSLHSFDASQSS